MESNPHFVNVPLLSITRTSPRFITSHAAAESYEDSMVSCLSGEIGKPITKMLVKQVTECNDEASNGRYFVTRWILVERFKQSYDNATQTIWSVVYAYRPVS